jgi:methylmalonyl-CoA mutase N-terminal domain/subunit
MAVDPLAGSYAVEALTLDIEREARALIEKLDAMGGSLAAIETGFVQNEIGDAAYKAQRAIEEHQDIVVGVNDFADSGSAPLPILKIDESVERDQVARLVEFRRRRDASVEQAAHLRALEALDRSAADGANLMPPIVEAVRCNSTLGEIVSTLKKTFGEHTDQGF